MPHRVEVVEPQGASVSSGGEVTTTKLEDYVNKVRAKSGEALQHLLAFINVAEHSPAPHYFPELQMEYLRDRVALVEERTEGLLNALQIQLDARREVDQDLHEPEVPAGLEQSTPAREDVVLVDVHADQQGEGGEVARRRNSSTRNLLDEIEVDPEQVGVGQGEGGAGGAAPAPAAAPEATGGGEGQGANGGGTGGPPPPPGEEPPPPPSAAGSVGRGTQTPLINRERFRHPGPPTNRAAVLTSAMRVAQESLRSARLGGSGQ